MLGDVMKSANDLYAALLGAEEDPGGGFITLSGGVSFPVEYDAVAGGCLLVRQAQKDLWKIFSELLPGNSKGMLILGPSGIGKSWAAMFFLVRLIKDSQTVVFESAGQRIVWILSKTGSRIIRGPADVLNCPELLLKSTTHIFDGKAGAHAYEPSASAAKLALFSSTNRVSYAQSERIVNYHAFYPSTTPDEFRRYVEMMKVDADVAKKIAGVIGTGKVRPLSQGLAATQRLLEGAIARLNIDKLKQYITSRPPVYGSGNILENPAMLFDVFLEMNENGPSRSLFDRYLFSNAQWEWVSKHVTNEVVESNIGRIKPLLQSFYISVGSVSANKSLGNLMGQIFEHCAAKLISDNGIEISELCEKSGVSALKTSIPKGLFVKFHNVAETKDILSECTDTSVLYVIGNNNHGFDFFNPPNNFFEVTNTLTGYGTHPVLYSAFETCCAHVKTSHVNLILVVEESQEMKWKKPLSFRINDEDIVKQIIQFESNKESPIKLNGVRSFSALPPTVQTTLKKVKQYRGMIDMYQGMRRSFHSLTPAAHGVDMFRLSKEGVPGATSFVIRTLVPRVFKIMKIIK